MHKLIAKKENIFGDNIAYVEAYDFSKANMSNESRLDVITLIASICYQNPKAHGSESLYNRLMAESGGLPSSSFEFVPMLFKKLYLDTIFGITNSYGLVFEDTNILKYGEKIIHDDEEYLLTNFRAVVYDFENLGIDLRDHFNTEAECQIIAKHFKVFKMKVDMPTFGQAVRHRINWQVMCVTGDTEIKTSQGKRSIKDMYDIQERQREKYSKVKYPTVKSYDFESKTFIYAPVKEIFKTEIKEAFEVIIQYGTDGKTRKIKTSADHKFLTKDGWVRLKDIKEKEFVALNGIPLYQDKDWLQKTKEDFLKRGIGLRGMSEELCINYNTLKKWMHKHSLQYTQKETSSTYSAWNKGIIGEKSHSFGKKHSEDTLEKMSKHTSKKLGETNQGFAKRMRTYWEATFRKTKILQTYNNKCIKCKNTENLEIDHILPVSTHPELGFDENNIQVLCKSCHREKSSIEAVKWKQTITFGMVKSITKVGEEQMYDMEIDHKDHNYIANSIVVHNSRRYVSGTRVPFDFYIARQMRKIITYFGYTESGSSSNELYTEDVIDICIAHYEAALAAGVKPQLARGIIPQCAYTVAWCAMQPKQFDSFINLRTDSHAQWEIQQLSKAMLELTHSEPEVIA